MGIIVTGSRHSIRPSLNLDFANSKVLDPRITFTRGSNATYYDGYTSVKAEENLVKYSQEFNNSYWIKEVATVTANSTSAPDGTTTAELLLETADTGTHKIYGNPPPYNYVTGNSFTVSIYCKSYVSDRYLGLVSQLGGGSRVSVRFDPNTQTLSSLLIVGSDITNATAGYQDVGNGWYRVYISGTFSVGYVYIAAAPSNTMTPLDQSYGFSSYSGDVTKGIYLWGAQIEQRDSVTAYTPTTTLPITKYQPALQTAGNNVARFDHNPTTGESLGLLIEEQRTNLVTYSEDFASGDDNWVTYASAINLSGTVNNCKVIPDLGQLIPSTNVRALRTALGSVGDTHTMSVFAKAGEYDSIRLESVAGNNVGRFVRAVFNLSNGTVTTSQGGDTTWFSAFSNIINEVGNGWYRCSIRYTIESNTTFTRPYWEPADSVATTGDGYSGVYMWGAQLEEASFPTSYMKTTGSQVTRSADNAEMTGTNFTDWFRQDEGTLYGEATAPYNNTSNIGLVSIDDTTTNNRIESRYCGTVRTSSRLSITANNTSQVELITANILSENSNRKLILSYKTNDFAFTANGTTVLTDTNGQVPVVSRLLIGNATYGALLNGTIKKIAYYPITLTDNEIQDLSEA